MISLAYIALIIERRARPERNAGPVPPFNKRGARRDLTAQIPLNPPFVKGGDEFVRSVNEAPI